MDRESLKAFVTAAGEYFVGLLGSGETAAISKARVILRDPNGPWRHGPVYVAIMARFSRIITLHGGFPDRFEFRRGGIATDIATGELVVDQLIRAAESGPDGDFWLYYFDNPDDDTDSADVPKVGYARVFPARLPRPDGRIVEIDYIVNSGFYLTSDGEFVQRILGALADGQQSMMFSITTPEDEGPVEGDDVAVSVTGAPTDTVHFAYRPAGSSEAFTYLGAATNREGVASFAWDTLDLPDDDYELVALYTEDEGYSVTYDAIEVSVDNVGGGGGGCVAVPVLPGGGGPWTPRCLLLSGLCWPTSCSDGGARCAKPRWGDVSGVDHARHDFWLSDAHGLAGIEKRIRLLYRGGLCFNVLETTCILNPWKMEATRNGSLTRPRERTIPRTFGSRP